MASNAAKRKPAQSETTEAVTTQITPPARPQGAVANAQLVGYVRENGQFIVAGLLQAASTAGEEQDWGEMSRYQSIAYEIGRFCGLNTQTQGGQGTARALGAGAGG